MKITTIKYEKLIPTGSYANEKIGFECSIEERENPLEVITKLRELAEQAHKEKYPHLYQEEDEDGYKYHNFVVTTDTPQSVTISNEKPSPKQLQIQLHIDTINTYKDPENLKRNFEKLANSHPDIKQAYEEKLTNLLNQIK